MDGARVQRVTTRWTTASRGGAGAQRRNQCPIAFAWPDSDVVWHDVVMREDTGFGPEETGHAEWPDVPRTELDALGLRGSEDRISLRPELSSWWMPRRHRRPPRQGIGPGEWLRWSVNYRIGLANRWEYGLVTLNVGFRVSSDAAFLGTPTRAVDELAHLR